MSIRTNAQPGSAASQPKQTTQTKPKEDEKQTTNTQSTQNTSQTTEAKSKDSKQTKETTAQQDNNIFDELTNWQDTHEESAKKAALKAKMGDESAFEQYYKEQEELGLEFDFMEGKDPENEWDYNNQISKLAQGEFNKKDANGDGKVTYEEFRDDELSSLDALDDQSLEIATKVTSFLMHSIIDQGMGNSDGNGTLSEAELESFYKNLDRFNGNGLDETGDGKFTTDTFDMPNWLVKQIFSEETISNAIRLAINGEI